MLAFGLEHCFEPWHLRAQGRTVGSNPWAPSSLPANVRSVSYDPQISQIAQIGSGGIAASKICVICGCSIILMKIDKVDISAVQDHGGIRS